MLTTKLIMFLQSTNPLLMLTLSMVSAREHSLCMGSSGITLKQLCAIGIHARSDRLPCVLVVVMAYTEAKYAKKSFTADGDGEMVKWESSTQNEEVVAAQVHAGVLIVRVLEARDLPSAHYHLTHSGDTGERRYCKLKQESGFKAKVSRYWFPLLSGVCQRSNSRSYTVNSVDTHCRGYARTKV